MHVFQSRVANKFSLSVIDLYDFKVVNYIYYTQHSVMAIKLNPYKYYQNYKNVESGTRRKRVEEMNFKGFILLSKLIPERIVNLNKVGAGI